MDPQSPAPIQPSEIPQPPVGPTTPPIQPPQPLPVVPAAPPTPTQPSPAVTPISPPVQTTPPKRTKMKALLMTAATLVLLGGGSAMAYFMAIVPNKPENVLKTALMNTAEANDISASIKADGKSDDSPAFKVEAKTQVNRSAKTSALDLKVTLTGVTVAAEARFIDEGAYIRVGDLANATEAIKAYSPEIAEVVTTLNAKVADKWFEIDSTLLKQTQSDCIVDGSVKFEQADYDFLEKLYKQNKFMVIDNTSSDSVNGQSATKYNLTVDHKTGEAFASGLEELPLFKKLNGCGQTEDKKSSPADQVIKKVEKSDATGKTPLSIWVDKKSKRISRVLVESTEQDRKDGVTGKIDVTMDYKPVSIVKPAESKPITTLLGELTGLFGGELSDDSL